MAGVDDQVAYCPGSVLDEHVLHVAAVLGIAMHPLPIGDLPPSGQPNQGTGLPLLTPVVISTILRPWNQRMPLRP
jgi:hypothetical protein